MPLSRGVELTQHLSPTSLAEAVRALSATPGLELVAGCTDLMVGAGVPELPDPAVPEPVGMLNVLSIPEIRGIRDRDGGLEIGAATTFTEVRASESIQTRWPALAAAAAEVGGWQIQNRATIGGNVVNASPAGDSLPVLLALDADVVVVSARGERVIPYREFHRGYRRTALEPGELLAWLRLAAPPSGTRQFFRKVGTREAQAISKVVVALVGRVDGGVVSDFRLAAGSVAATPIRFSSLEAEIIGRPADRETAQWAGEAAAAAVTPIDDVRSTAEYRKHVLERVVNRLALELFS